ncbi:unnamed protein product [Arabidopsis thaliana]|nr:unnamed protein product [Arabidopsis thaliana]
MNTNTQTEQQIIREETRIDKIIKKRKKKMRAQVLLCPTITAYGRLYCAPRRLHRYNSSSSSSQFLNLNLSRFSGALFFHMEVCSLARNLCFSLFSTHKTIFNMLMVLAIPEWNWLERQERDGGKFEALMFVGTGYLTGCFALMVGAEGRVVGVDHIPELVDMSIKNIEKSVAASFLKKGSLSLHVGDGRKGWQEFAPYDAIHVGAAASEIPQPLLDQLKPGGRMVIPLGTYFQELKVIDKNEDGSIKVHTETSVRYVPLTSRVEQLGGF